MMLTRALDSSQNNGRCVMEFRQESSQAFLFQLPTAAALFHLSFLIVVKSTLLNIKAKSTLRFEIVIHSV